VVVILVALLSDPGEKISNSDICVGKRRVDYLQQHFLDPCGQTANFSVRPMKRLILLSVLALLPTIALAQTGTSKVDCSAYHKNDDRLWTIIHDNVIILDGKPISINMKMACCFGSDSKRLMLGGVNVIRIVEKSCS